MPAYSLGAPLKEYTPIPGPPGLPVLGNIFDIDTEQSTKSCFHLARKYGEIFQLKGPGVVVVFVNSAELVTEVCAEDRFRKLVEGGLIELREALNHSLLTADTSESAWEDAHRVAMPYLTPVKIRELFDDMKDIVTQLCLKWSRQGPSHAIDVNKDFTSMALDVVGLCGFHFRFNSFYNSVNSNDIGWHLERLIREANARQWRLPWLSRLRVLKKKHFTEDVDFMRSLSRDLIAKRRADSSEHSDVLSAFLREMDSEADKKFTDRSSLSDESLIDNMLTLLAAGHETTSGTLSFALFFLTQHPEALLKAQQEVDKAMKDGKLAVESLSQLPYIDAILRETLRFHSTVPLIARVSDEDQELGKGGKYFVKKGTAVVINIFASQRDADVYGDDVDEWKPERMLGDKFKKLPIGAWRAFGTGVRACIGRAFAWQEMQIALAMLLYSFNFEAVDPKYQLRYRDAITLNPVGFELRAHLRNEKRYASLVSGDPSPPDFATLDVSTNDQKGASDTKPIKILFGSDNGMAQSLAHLFAAHATRRGYTADVDSLNAAKENLPAGQPIIIFTSSYNGEPPLTAAHFVSWLQSLSGSELNGVTYTVFGCGHRDWTQTFQRIPILVDDLLAKRGAKRMAKLSCADAATGDTLSDFQDWEEQQLWPALVTGNTLDDAVSHEDVKAQDPTTVAEQDAIPGVITLQQNHEQAHVSDIRVLTEPQAVKKMHIELTLPANSEFQVGDYIVIAPVNPQSIVQRVLSWFKLAWDHDLKISGIPSGVSRREVEAYYFLRKNVELAQPASSRNIRYLASLATQEASKEALTNLADRDKDHNQTILDLLETFSDIEITIHQYLSMLPALRARTYSISSSPLADPRKATLTLSILTKSVNPTTGSPDVGIASSYLAGLSKGAVIRHNIRSPRTNFTLPATPSDTPIIMIAAGSGIAPFRGFIQERHILIQTGRKLADAILFFGCRSQDADDLYRLELDEWQTNHAVTVHRAFSRPNDGADKKYVQDILRDHAQQLQSMWSQGARCYVCGAASMADAVRTALQSIVGSLDSTEGREDRFLTEIFS